MSAPKAGIVLAAAAACLLCACGANVDSPATADPAPDRPLRGTTWAVTEVLGTDEALDPVAAQAHLLIAEYGAVSGSAGCNNLIGTATVRDETATTATIDFRVGTTRMMCEPERMAVENAVLSVLIENTEAAISGDRLTLSRKS